jgi:hypothetical protein
VVDGRLRILISGMVAGDPGQGGATWAVLQYVRGLERLGHKVVLVEPVEEFTHDVVRYFRGLGLDQAALLVRGSDRTEGLSYEELVRFAGDADLLVNVSGMLRDPELIEPIGARVYLDLDPAFNQLWHAVEGIDVGFAGHTHFVTVGQAIAGAVSPVPTCGLKWIGTLPPVVLSAWPRAHELEHDALTTVGNWRGYGSIEYDGVLYGQKVHSLRRLVELPARTSERFLLALAIHADEARDLRELDTHGWQLVDPTTVAGNPEAYARFVRGSKGEFGLAKSGYVVSRCGWFSDRSACYLASGRPVIAQDTGFGEFLPTATGLFAFEDVEGALDAIDQVNADYPRHAAGARALAEEHLDSDKVLGALLQQVGVTP